jgi:hypothetical protein
MKFFTASLLFSLLAQSAFCASEFFSFEQYAKLYETKTKGVSIERLLGNWRLTGVALTGSEIQNILGAATGYYPNGVRNRDGSHRAELNIESIDEQSKQLNITISGIGRKEVSQGPKKLMVSLPANKISFGIQAYDRTNTVKSHFQYDCRYVWAEREDEDSLLCVIRFVPSASEYWAEEVMQLKNKQLAYYRFLKVSN